MANMHDASQTSEISIITGTSMVAYEDDTG